jgi:hypothetical protein
MHGYVLYQETTTEGQESTKMDLVLGSSVHGIYQMLKIAWAAEQISAPEDGLNSREIVT